MSWKFICIKLYIKPHDILPSKSTHHPGGLRQWIPGFTVRSGMTAESSGRIPGIDARRPARLEASDSRITPPPRAIFFRSASRFQISRFQQPEGNVQLVHHRQRAGVDPGAALDPQNMPRAVAKRPIHTSTPHRTAVGQPDRVAEDQPGRQRQHQRAEKEMAEEAVQGHIERMAGQWWRHSTCPAAKVLASCSSRKPYR